MEIKEISVSYGETVPAGNYRSKKYHISVTAGIDDKDALPDILIKLWMLVKNEIVKQKKDDNERDKENEVV